MPPIPQTITEPIKKLMVQKTTIKLTTMQEIGSTNNQTSQPNIVIKPITDKQPQLTSLDIFNSFIIII